jgi:DNA (cytosine-5)-methyltransferase 1
MTIATDTGYDSTDLFCGAGGSGIGAAAAGIELYLAANHSERAIQTHSANFPDTEHDCADISQVNPRRYRRTDFLWASPECTNHSGAKGKKRAAQMDLFAEPDPTAERSRATMWDVPRFAEHHRYDCVIVENVVEIADWEMWPAWLHAMRCLGYQHRPVSLNSMHAPAQNAPRAPQSRDRVYVVFWRGGIPEPDLEVRPAAYCQQCETQVQGVQWWKKPGQTIGRYRSQYLYRCPDCRNVVEPYALAAAAAIDWSLPGQRIGDRTRALKPATLARIQAGLERYAGVPQLVPAGGTWNDGTSPVTDPMRARTTRENEGLLVPVEGRDGLRATSTGAPMRTQTTRHQDALVVPYYSTAVPQPADVPLPTQTTVDRFGLAFIAELRGGGSTHRPVTQPLATVTASGTHHMLVRQNTARGNPAQMCTPVTEPARTLTTAGHQSLVGWPQLVPDINDCTFRMLQVPEIAAAMAFPTAYQILGTKREQVRQLGNAVTPPASEWLYRRCIDAMNKSSA